MQISFIIYLANLTNKVNIIYLSFIKSKHVTQSILSAELYKKTHDFDISAIVKAMLGNLLQVEILLIFYINSKFLYNYLVKLGIIQGKHLIVDVISFY